MDLSEPLAPFRLDGRVVIVTGTSSGLGERFARVVHAAGARVVVGARRAKRLDALVAELDGAVAVACDVTEDADLERLVTTAVGRFGRIDVLVNNAGVGEKVKAEDETPEHLRRVLDVNLVGAYRLCQMAGRHMLDQGAGSIVNVSSVLGLVAANNLPQPGYVASKHGLIGLTRDLAQQWARRGVRVERVVPRLVPERDDHGGDVQRRGRPAVDAAKRAHGAWRGDPRTRRGPVVPGQRRQHLRDGRGACRRRRLHRGLIVLGHEHDLAELGSRPEACVGVAGVLERIGGLEGHVHGAPNHQGQHVVADGLGRPSLVLERAAAQRGPVNPATFGHQRQQVEARRRRRHPRR